MGRRVGGLGRDVAVVAGGLALAGQGVEAGRLMVTVVHGTEEGWAGGGGSWEEETWGTIFRETGASAWWEAA